MPVGKFQSGNRRAGSSHCGATAFERKRIIVLSGLLAMPEWLRGRPGGSITAGLLGLLWSKLQFDNGKAANFGLFVDGIRAMADTTVDAGAVIGGIFLPGTISDRVAQAYDDVLFKGAKLSDLPDDSGKKAPHFVINATNIQSSVLWRFSRPYMADYRVGMVRNPDVALCSAVAASSAFPPTLSPMTLPIRQKVEATKGADLNLAPYTTQAVLSDGGVYDNLGLETTKRFKTLLVSDAGQKIAPEPDPHHDWVRHSLRILDTIDNQVRSLRKRTLIDSYKRGDHTGTSWGIRTDFADYKLASDPLKCLTREPAPLAKIPTRLEKMPRDVQNRLMNWGYAICDAALRAHVDAAAEETWNSNHRYRQISVSRRLLIRKPISARPKKLKTGCRRAHKPRPCNFTLVFSADASDGERMRGRRPSNRLAQIIDATFSSPIRRASARTSRFWSSRSWNNSGIAADFSC
jgi:NTE family protein